MSSFLATSGCCHRSWPLVTVLELRGPPQSRNGEGRPRVLHLQIRERESGAAGGWGRGGALTSSMRRGTTMRGTSRSRARSRTASTRTSCPSANTARLSTCASPSEGRRWRPITCTSACRGHSEQPTAQVAADSQRLVGQKQLGDGVQHPQRSCSTCGAGLPTACWAWLLLPLGGSTGSP